MKTKTIDILYELNNEINRDKKRADVVHIGFLSHLYLSPLKIPGCFMLAAPNHIVFPMLKGFTRRAF